MDTFDLIIIGSGSGNAIPEYLSDWRIAIVEKGTFGGTCLNVGCIPSKMYVIPADRLVAARNNNRLGIHTSVDSIDWPTMRDRIFNRIDQITAGGRQYRATGSANVELVEGHGRFINPTQIEVDGRILTGDRFLVAAGARPSIPDIAGLTETRYHTSDSIMRLDELPERLAIIGGGYIAAEMGHVFSALGSNVTQLVRSGRILKSQDREISDRFAEVYGPRVDLRFNTEFQSVRQHGDAVIIQTAEGDLEVDQLLIATGRIPNTDLLNPEKAGFDLNRDNTIAVDATMATTVPNIWAIGDVANSFQLKHLANREAAAAFWNMANPDNQRTVSTKALPHAVFSNPQLAGVGLTEEQAEAAGHDFVVGRRDYGGTAYGWALEDTTSFAKVIIDRRSGNILGCHIIGPDASNLVQIATQAITFDQDARTLAEDVYYIHPALTEVVENALLDGVQKL